MAFTRIRVSACSDPEDDFGYLGSSGNTVMLPGHIQDAALVKGYQDAYLYEWVDCGNSYWRLDQQTSGGENRSLTYTTDDSTTMVACWGLADNWIYLTQVDSRICYDDDSVRYTLRYGRNVDFQVFFYFEVQGEGGPWETEVVFLPVP